MAPEQLHRIGLNSDCPVDQVRLGGLSFVKKSQKVTGYGHETERTNVRGTELKVTEDQLRLALKAAHTRVIRTAGGKGKERCRIYDTTSRRFLPRPGDVALVDYVYAEPLSAAQSVFQDVQRPSLKETLTTSATPAKGKQGRRTA